MKVAVIIYFLFLSCNGMISKQESDEGSDSILLSISLQEGFQKEHVQVFCNDRKLYDRQDLTSDIRYGLAESFEIPIEEGLNEIVVVLPDRGLTRKFQVQSQKQQYVGISILKDDLDIKFSDEPFGYL